MALRSRVFVHVAGADLECPDVRQLGELGQQVRGERCPGPRGVDVDDQRQRGRVTDGREVIEAMFGFEAKT
jgi:IS5 family transposase